MYLKPTELESTFIEILNPKKTKCNFGLDLLPSSYRLK